LQMGLRISRLTCNQKVPMTIFTRNFTRNLVLTGIVASLPALAHEPEKLEVPAHQMGLVETPPKGSSEFAKELLGCWQGLVKEERIESMRELSRHLDWLEAAGSNAAIAPDEKQAAWLRWRVGQDIEGLANSVHGLRTLDFRRTGFIESEIVSLDAQQATMILKVVFGEGPVEFATHELDFTSERDPDPYTVETVNRTGTLFVLLKLSSVPAGEPTTTRLAFKSREEGTPTRLWAFRFTTRANGNLAIRIVDENGKTIPAMVRLTAMPTRRLFEPAGAVDLRPMMNDITDLPIYGPGRGYMLYLPEPWRGHYWVMSGPFEMALPPGEWQLHVWRGLEYAPAKVEVKVESGDWTRKEIRLKRWVDMKAEGWLSGDDHVHARVMSGEDADKLMAWTQAADISICNVLEMGDEVRTWYAQRGFGPDFRVRDGDHWIVPGQEDPRGVLGHAIGLNITAKVRDLDNYLDQRRVADEIHRQGGLYGHTHVGAKALFVEREMALYTPFGLVDFNSVMQAALNTDLMYDYLNLGYKMSASAGSDTPYGGTVGCVRMYALVGKDDSPDAWFRAVGKGNTFVTTGPMIDFKIGGAVPGDEVQVADDIPLKVRIVAKGLAGKSAPKSVRLVRFGEVIKEVLPSTEGQESVTLEAEVPSGHGCWLAAHVVGVDGSEALSTPIYVIRPGFRWWDIRKVPGLLKGQLEVLDQVDAMVADSKRLLPSRPTDFTLRSVVKSADTLQEQVALARAHYGDLIKVHAEETKSRESR